MKLRQGGGYTALRECGEFLFEQMLPFAEILDVAANSHQYSEALQYHERMIHDTELTPSAIMLAEMREKGEGFYEFANRMSQAHKRYFDISPLNSERCKFLEQSISESHQKQKQIEANDKMSFAEFMRAYEQS